jgi:hypothetical protein
MACLFYILFNQRVEMMSVSLKTDDSTIEDVNVSLTVGYGGYFKYINLSNRDSKIILDRDQATRLFNIIKKDQQGNLKLPNLKENI